MAKPKKLLIVMLACIFIFGILAGCFAKIPNLHDAVIKNFEQYTSIGVGKPYEQPQGKAKALLSQRNDNFRLMGIKKDGLPEEIVFQSEGKDVEMPLYLRGFVSCDKFTVVDYSERQPTWLETVQLGNQLYIADNDTGKVYSLESFEDVVFYPAPDFGSTLNYNLFENSNSLFIKAYKGGEGSWYKFSVENGDLKIEEWIKEDMLPRYRPAFVDQYDNMFLISESKNWLILNNQKEISGIETEGEEMPWLAMNGRVYFQNKVFNKDGVLTETDFVPQIGYYNSDMLIKREGNKSYYYVAEESHQEEDSRIIMVEYGQNEEYTLHEIELEDYSENYAIANDKVYFLKDESVFYVEITTGKKTVVTSDYIYKDIRANNLGEVFFTAIDKKMNYIYGMIQKDGTLSTTVKENSFDMLIVNPLN